jgi:hypothetical protein
MSGMGSKLSQSLAFSSDSQNQFAGARGGFSSTMARIGGDDSITNRIHFFKFDQRILTFYNVDTDKKTRELLNIDFNIPIRFCSIQTREGRIFITGGARNSS